MIYLFEKLIMLWGAFIYAIGYLVVTLISAILAISLENEIKFLEILLENNITSRGRNKGKIFDRS